MPICDKLIYSIPVHELIFDADFLMLILICKIID